MILDLFELDHSKFQQEDETSTIESSVETIPPADGDPEVMEVTEETTKLSLEDDQESIKETQTPETSSAVTESSLDITEVINDLVEEDLIIFDDETEYEPSSEGLKGLIKDTLEKMPAKVLAQYKESLPDNASEFLDILEKGGTVEDYINLKQQIDFAKVPLEREGKPIIQNQLALVEDWLKVQGHTEEEIVDLISDYQETGILKKQAEIAKKRLTTWQEDNNKKLLAERERAIQLAREEEQQAVEEFKEQVLNTREIAGFKLSKDKAEKLYDFITKPTKGGKTQFQLTDTNENRLLYAYMAMEGFDKEKLVKDIKTKERIKLKKALSNYRDSQAAPSRGASDVRRSSDSGISDIKWII